jgi:hypothetical protein
MFRDFPSENTNGPRRGKTRASRLKVSKPMEWTELNEDFKLQEIKISGLECWGKKYFGAPGESCERIYEAGRRVKPVIIRVDPA